MSFSITRAQRSLLFFFSASGYIAWCSGLDGRLEAEIIATPHLQMLASLPQRPPPRVSSIILRDPFAEEQPDAVPVADANGADPSVSNAALADDGPRVPDIADLPGSDASVPQTLTLKATIVGSNPVAYVQDGPGMDIVRVGDLLGGRRVNRIYLQGVSLSDGTRLALPGMFVPTPPPEMPAPAKTGAPVADLRKTLAEQQAAGKAPATDAAPQATPTPSPGFPSPAPRPTVNQNGIPVGVNPTSDPNAPTPYPYPYPYAPQR